jgi:hypothetical protein
MNEKKLFSPVYESLFYFFLDFVVDKLILIEFFLGSYLGLWCWWVIELLRLLEDVLRVETI